MNKYSSLQIKLDFGDDSDLIKGKQEKINSDKNYDAACLDVSKKELFGQLNINFPEDVATIVDSKNEDDLAKGAVVEQSVEQNLADKVDNNQNIIENPVCNLDDSNKKKSAVFEKINFLIQSLLLSDEEFDLILFLGLNVPLEHIYKVNDYHHNEVYKKVSETILTRDYIAKMFPGKEEAFRKLKEKLFKNTKEISDKHHQIRRPDYSLLYSLFLSVLSTRNHSKLDNGDNFLIEKCKINLRDFYCKALIGGLSNDGITADSVKQKSLNKYVKLKSLAKEEKKLIEDILNPIILKKIKNSAVSVSHFENDQIDEDYIFNIKKYEEEEKLRKRFDGDCSIIYSIYDGLLNLYLDQEICSELNKEEKDELLIKAINSYMAQHKSRNNSDFYNFVYRSLSENN